METASQEGGPALTGEIMRTGSDTVPGRALARADSLSPLMPLAGGAADPLLETVRVMAQLHELAKMLVASGFCPKAVNTPEKAMAIMLTGREMGIGPMLAIRAVNIIDGKPVIAADLQLARFKAGGGRAVFKQLDEKTAVLFLRHPNGDEHTETWTHDMAQAAGLLTKDNWKKHKVAMMRSRVITAGLKSIGFEATAGVYDPDEADHWQPGASDAIERGEDPNALGARTTATLPRAATPNQNEAPSSQRQTSTGTSTTSESTTSASSESRYASRWMMRDGREGTALDAENDEGFFIISAAELEKAGKFAYTKLQENTAKDPDAMRQFCADAAAELSRREMLLAERRANAVSSEA